jgi:hypothetical protein
MGVTLDIRKAHAAHKFGDIVQVLTWVNDERAMVLMAANRANSPWFIVCESASWKYDNPQYLARQAAKCAEVLGMDQNKSTWVKIATIIHEGLPDLIRMPSKQPPEFHAGNFGQMTLRGDGEIIRQEAIRLEDEGAMYG